MRHGYRGAAVLATVCTLAGCSRPPTPSVPDYEYPIGTCAEVLDSFVFAVGRYFDDTDDVIEVGSSVPCTLVQPVYYDVVSDSCLAQIISVEWEASVPGIVSFSDLPTDHPLSWHPILEAMCTGEAVGETHIWAKITIPGRVLTVKYDQPVVVVPATPSG